MEKLIRDTELQEANAVTTPGVKPLAHQLEQEEPLSMADFTRFRGQAARANYVGLDRPDMIYDAKEVCSGMPFALICARQRSSGWFATSGAAHAWFSNYLIRRLAVSTRTRTPIGRDAHDHGHRSPTDASCSDRTFSNAGARRRLEWP